MAFNPLSSLFGWTASKGRSRAAYSVSTSSGDTPADSSLNNDTPGIAWAEATVEAPCEDATQLTVAGSAVASGRQFMANMTVSGAVTIKLLKGATLTLTFPVGFTVLPMAVTQVTVNAGTGTFWNLK